MSSFLFTFLHLCKGDSLFVCLTRTTSCALISSCPFLYLSRPLKVTVSPCCFFPHLFFFFLHFSNGLIIYIDFAVKCAGAGRAELILCGCIANSISPAIKKPLHLISLSHRYRCPARLDRTTAAWLVNRIVLCSFCWFCTFHSCIGLKNLRYSFRGLGGWTAFALYYIYKQICL